MTISQLPFAKHAVGKLKGKDYKLPEKLFLDQWIIAAGTIIKLATSPNFGIVCLPEDCQDIRGFVVPRRLFRY